MTRRVRVVHTMSVQTGGAFKWPEEIADLTAAKRKAAEALAAQIP